jgi:putative transposase
LAISEVRTLYIEPGSSWENAYAESFIGRIGDELLKREAFAGLVEAKLVRITGTGQRLLHTLTSL